MLRVTRTENGMVRGLPATDPLITVYKGIPFAAPPVGRNRWRVPQPAENWEGVRDCYTFAPAALQQIPGVDFENMYVKEFWSAGLAMSEDCLYLNIWTPAKSADERLPVMVWIHGGGMQCGYTFEPEFDGMQIARRGVLLVTIPYRVSALGFLAHPELTAETGGVGCTNFGLYDQKAALDWVKRNIASSAATRITSPFSASPPAGAASSSSLQPRSTRPARSTAPSTSPAAVSAAD